MKIGDSGSWESGIGGHCGWDAGKRGYGFEVRGWGVWGRVRILVLDLDKVATVSKPY